MARTKKPCPGCGYSEDYPFREADKVCPECQRALKRIKAIDARPWDLSGEEILVLVGEEDREFDHPQYPYFSSHYRKASWSEAGREEAKNVLSCLLKAIRYIGEPAGSSHIVGSCSLSGEEIDHLEKEGKTKAKYEKIIGKDVDKRPWGESHNGDLVVLPKELAEIFVELDASLRKALEIAYAEGKKAGRSLLIALAAGDVSVKEFNQLSAEIDEEGD